MTGCERLEFNPGLSVQPTSTQAETPTGLDVGPTLPQTYENPFAIATSHLKKRLSRCPQGMTVNPSAGEGLGACTPAQYEAETLETSLPGKAAPTTRALARSRSIRRCSKKKRRARSISPRPYDNPFPEEGHPGGSLLAIYVVARIPERGVLVKVAGKVDPEPRHGPAGYDVRRHPAVAVQTISRSASAGAAAPLVTPAGVWGLHGRRRNSRRGRSPGRVLT